MNNKLPDYCMTKKEAEDIYGRNNSKNTLVGKAHGYIMNLLCKNKNKIPYDYNS